MQLAHARLGHAEHPADLGERAVLQVVELDDRPVPLAEPGHGGVELAHRLPRLHDGHRVGRRVGEQLRNTAADLVERLHAHHLHLPDQALHLAERQLHLDGDLAVGRGALEPPLQPLLSPFQLANPAPHGAGHPVLGAQLVEDRSADPLHGEALEARAALRVEALDRVDEAEYAALGEVGVIDVRGQPRHHPVCDDAHERACSARRAGRGPRAVGAARYSVHCSSSGSSAGPARPADACRRRKLAHRSRHDRAPPRPELHRPGVRRAHARGCACSWTTFSRSTVTCV